MPLEAQAGTLADLQSTLVDLRDRIVTGMKSPRPDYVQIAEYKKAYEANLSAPANRPALRALRLRADVLKDSDPDAYDNIVGALDPNSPFGVRTALGSAYDFDKREGTVPYNMTTYGLTDKQAIAIDRATNRAADATPEDALLAGAFSLIKDHAPSNVAVKQEMNRFESLRNRADALGGLTDYAALKLFGFQRKSDDAVTLPQLRKVYDVVSKAVAGKGDAKDPDETGRLAVNIMAGALNSGGEGRAPYVIQGILSALDADPGAATNPGALQQLITRSTTWAVDTQHVMEATRVAARRGLTGEETDRLIEARGIRSMVEKGVIRGDAPKAKAALNTINELVPKYDTESGFATAIDAGGESPLVRNLLKATGRVSVDRLPEGVRAQVPELMATAGRVSALERKFNPTALAQKVEGLGDVDAKSILEAFTPKQGMTFTQADYKRQAAVLEKAREAVSGDPAKRELVDSWLLSVNDAAAGPVKDRYQTEEQALSGIAAKYKQQTVLGLKGQIASIKEQVAAGMEDVYAEVVGSLSGAWRTIGPNSQERADIAWTSAMERRKVDIGGKSVSLLQLVGPPGEGTTPFGLGSYLWDKVGDIITDPVLVKGAEPVRKEMDKLADNVIRDLVVNETLAFDSKLGRFAYEDSRSGPKGAKEIEGVDPRTLSGAQELVSSLTGGGVTDTDLADYHEKLRKTRRLGEITDAVGAASGVPGLVPASLLTGLVGKDAETVIAQSNYDNASLTGDGASKDALTRSQIGLNNAKTARLYAQQRYDDAMLNLRKAALAVAQDKSLSESARQDKLYEIKAQASQVHAAYEQARTEAVKAGY